MKLGLSLPMFTADVRRPLDAAARAAAAGYDGVFAPDHLFPPSAPDRPSLEPFTVLAAVAGLHPRLRIGTLVTRASLRPVGLLAKQASALDGIGQAGLILGLGAGDHVSRREHETFGIPFATARERVEILEETAQALRTLFDGRPWGGGRHLPPVSGPLRPPGRPEIWIGGRSDPVIAAAARAADAWNGWGMDAGAFHAAVGRLASLSDGRPVSPTWGGIVLVGRNREELSRVVADRRSKGLDMDVWIGTADELRTFAARLHDVGCSWLISVPVGGDDRLELVADVLHG
ncbi:MAG TPA: LLM class flavin-dependent oxidoreductase [Actinomycetota bacterium]|nr:LLM class flavin-dependent oxidoreductase [Actinomycetota bacterium]